MPVTPESAENQLTICSLADSCEIITKLIGRYSTIKCRHLSLHRPIPGVCTVKTFCPQTGEDVVCQ